MKKNSLIRYAAGILSVCLAFTLSSCSSDDDYTPGAPTAEGAIGAYFDSSNSTSFVLTPEEESIQLTVSRKNADDAAVVPINIVSEDTTAIQVPESIEFAAGDSTQTLTIGVKGLNTKKTYNFKLAIGESAADHYAIQDGTTIYSGSVIVSQWKQIKDSMRFYFYGNDNLPEAKSEMWQLDGVNQFYITNFMGTGVSMYFSIDDTHAEDVTFNADDESTWVGEIIPVNGKGAATFDYSTYKMHYVWLGVDSNGSDIYNWRIGDTSIDYFDWYGSYDYYTYSWIDCSQNYIYLYGYISSNKYTGYAQVYGVWK